MGYGFDLVRLQAGSDRTQVHKKKLQEQEQARQPSAPANPAKEEAKQRLAKALQERHPTLEAFRHDYSQIARARSISEAEARRLYRNVELNERRLSFQIVLFDDTAGASFSFSGPGQECAAALRVLWDCLQILESEGGFSTYDPQLGRVLELNSDFDVVRNCACGA